MAEPRFGRQTPTSSVVMLNYGQKMPYSITQPVRVSGWMSGWMQEDGVLSSFHFNVFSNSLRIRSPYAPPLPQAIDLRFFSALYNMKSMNRV